MDRASIKQLIDSSYQQVDGFAIAKESMEKMGYYFCGYDYGESLSDSFYDMLSLTNPKPGEVFYDFGSGLGKKVVMAGLGFPFKAIIGIEALEGLHEEASRIMNKHFSSHFLSKGTRVELKCGDILYEQVDDGDVFYISIEPTALASYIPRLHEQLLRTKLGTRIITSGVPIRSSFFKIELATQAEYLTGKGVMYLHKKVA